MLVFQAFYRSIVSGRDMVPFAGYEVIVSFNDSQTGRLTSMSSLGFNIVINARSFATEMDGSRIKKAEKKSEMSTLESRRARKLAKLAAEEEK
jgi:hypothetical protein